MFTVRVLTKGIGISFVDPRSPASPTCSLNQWMDNQKKSGITTRKLIEELDSAYDRRYGDSEVNIFDMVDIRVFNVIELDEMVLQLDEGLYPLACDEDVRCLATIVRSFKFLEAFMEHDYTIVNSYQSTHGKDSVCNSVTPRLMPHGLLTPHTDKSFSAINLILISVEPTVNEVIDNVIRHISFDDMKLDREAGFGDVAGSSIDNFGLSHDDSFGVDDLDLNLNFTLDLNVPQTKTQEEVVMSKVPNDHVVNESDTHVDVKPAGNVGRTEEHGNGEEFVEHRSGEEAVEHGNGEEFDEHGSGQQVQYDVDGIDCAYKTQYYDKSSEDACTNDDDGEDDDLLDVPFDNIGVTSLVPEDVDVVNVDGFESNTGYEDETCSHRRRSSKEAKGKVYLYSIENRRNMKLYKNDKTKSLNPNMSVKIAVERNTNPSLPTKHLREYMPSIGSCWIDSNNGIYPLAYALVEAESESSWCKFLQCLGDDINLQPNSNFTFINDRQKEIGIDRDSSAFGQAEHAEPAVGQDGSGVGQVPNAYGSGIGVVIGLSSAGG
ncbi:hypothetical protein Tco_1070686 [Tanacetum coccineum]|uniref:Uncharacterized protein n=1 Tax=Tanacetum coccineum TaxID=301880 RepID=A0ABQ5HN92_9ASTR